MSIEITPASLAQVVKGRGGRFVYIDDDVTGIAKQLAEVHPDLRLAYNEGGEYWVVYQLDREPATGAVRGEHLVTTALELDSRLVERIRKIASPGYDLVVELEKGEAEDENTRDARFSEEVRERAEHLAHALRKDYFGADVGRYFYPAPGGQA